MSSPAALLKGPKHEVAKTAPAVAQIWTTGFATEPANRELLAKGFTVVEKRAMGWPASSTR
jgi:hypothetical protein